MSKINSLKRKSREPAIEARHKWREETLSMLLDSIGLQTPKELMYGLVIYTAALRGPNIDRIRDMTGLRRETIRAVVEVMKKNEMWPDVHAEKWDDDKYGDVGFACDVLCCTGTLTRLPGDRFKLSDRNAGEPVETTPQPSSWKDLKNAVEGAMKNLTRTLTSTTQSGDA